MPHISFVVCCIFASCSIAWAMGMASKPKEMPMGPDDTLPSIKQSLQERERRAVGDAQVAFLYRSPRRNHSYQIQKDHVLSSASAAMEIAKPSTSGGVTNVDLVMLGAGRYWKVFQTQHVGTLPLVWWLVIFLVGVPVGCGLLCALSSCFRQDDDATVKGKVVGDSQEPLVANRFSPAPAATVPAGRTASRTASMESPAGQPRDVSDQRPPSMVGAWTPQSLSRAVWTSGAVPPPLCANVAPFQSMTSYWISTRSLRQLYNRSAIEVVGAFDYAMVRARLFKGLGGSRLEVASEPSFRDLLSSVAPLDYPGNLSPNALLHGPKCELYGPFQRYGPGFTVGHFSRIDNVFTMAPKRTPEGLAIEISSTSFGGQQLAVAYLVDGRTRYQIDVQPGVDTILVITCVLAAFVASQNMIDEVGTTIG